MIPGIRSIRARVMGRPLQLLPKASPQELFPALNDVRITLDRVFQGAYGDMRVEEMVIVAGICQSIKARNIFEFGTLNGMLSRQMALNLPSDGCIYTLDLPPEQMSTTKWEISDPRSQSVIQKPCIGANVSDFIQDGRVKQLLGDSASYDYSGYRGKMDLVVVDACHEYAFAKSDSENALKMVHSSGVIIWHDYASDWPGVVQCLNELGSSKSLYHIPGTSLVVYKGEALRSQ